MRLEYFQLIDRIVELKLAERKIRSEATVPEKSTIFEGHFPGNPLMPGVLLIEAMAQTCGWLVVAATRFERMPFLASVESAKFRTFVTPGTVLSVQGQLDHEGSGYAVAHAKVTADAKAVCDATLKFRVLEFPNPAMEKEMHALAERISFPKEALADG